MPTPPPTIAPPPTTQLPPSKDVPWWGVLIVALLVSIISVVGTLYALKPSTGTPGMPAGFSSLLTDSITFLPHILILFGVLADIFTMQGAYSIPSLVGICSIPINWALGKGLDGLNVVFTDLLAIYNTRRAVAAVAKGGGMSQWDGCEVKGFELLKSEYAPQGLVVTATVFWYYLLDLMINRDPMDTILTWISFILFFGLQAMQLASCDNMQNSFFVKTFIALAEGFIIGGTGYGIVQSSIPTRLPSAILPQGPSLTSLTKQADGSYTDASGKAYIVGPDGRPIPMSFIQAATTAPS